MARLVNSLKTLRSETDRAYPRRGTDSDGWIGDQPHARTKSDHNPDERGLVHGLDVDADLDPDDPAAMDRLVAHQVERHRTGADDRLTYIIWCPRTGERAGKSTIWSARRGWRPKDYTGSNRHDKHAHFSATYDPGREDSVRSWHVEDIVFTKKDEETVRAIVREELIKFGQGDGDPGPREYSRDGLNTVVERRTDDIIRRLKRIEDALPAPTPPPAAAKTTGAGKS